MPNTTKLDGTRLHAIAHSSHSAEVTMTALALRERNRNFSDIGRTKTALIRSGEKIVDEEYRKFWKDLELEGVGAIVYGRRGMPDRFEWYYSLKNIANAALTGKDVVIEKPSEVKEPKKAAKPVGRRKGARMSLSEKKDRVNHTEVSSVGKSERMVYIPLRSNFHLDFKLPSDISPDEIEVIQKALKKLSA